MLSLVHNKIIIIIIILLLSVSSIQKYQFLSQSLFFSSTGRFSYIENVGSIPRGHKSSYVQYTCLPSKCIWINAYYKWINALQGTSITS